MFAKDGESTRGTDLQITNQLERRVNFLCLISSPGGVQTPGTPVVQEQRIVCAQNIRSQGGFMEGELGFSSCLTFPAHLRAGNPSMSLEISFSGWKFLLRTKSRVDRCA